MKKIIFITFSSIFLNFASAEIPLKLSLGYGEAIRANNRFDNHYTGMTKSYLFNSFPMINLNYGPLNIGANGIMVSFIGDREVAGYINFNRYGERYYGTQMDKRKESWMTGLGFKYHNFNLLLSKDSSHRSNSLRFSTSYSEIFMPSTNHVLRLSASLEFFNSRFSNYYFGVKTSEVTTTRSYYSPKGYFVPGVSIFSIYKIHDKVNLTSGLSIKKLSNEIIKSPTTNGLDFEIAFIFGLSWIFY